MMFPEGYNSSSHDPNLNRVKLEKDPGISNCYTFTILKEDHTLGNLLTQELLNEPRVLFAGYRIVHPMSDLIVVRVNVNDNIDQPEELVKETIERLCSDFKNLSNQLETQIDNRNNRGQEKDMHRRGY